MTPKYKHHRAGLGPIRRVVTVDALDTSQEACNALDRILVAATPTGRLLAIKQRATLHQKDLLLTDEIAWVAQRLAHQNGNAEVADRQREPAARMSGRSKNTRALMLAGGKWTAHDLRRTAATLMAGAGVSTDTIDECLNHKLQSKVARVYVKDRRLPEQARAFDALGAKLDNIINGSSLPSNVIALQAA